MSLVLDNIDRTLRHKMILYNPSIKLEILKTTVGHDPIHSLQEPRTTRGQSREIENASEIILMRHPSRMAPSQLPLPVRIPMEEQRRPRSGES